MQVRSESAILYTGPLLPVFNVPSGERIILAYSYTHTDILQRYSIEETRRLLDQVVADMSLEEEEVIVSDGDSFDSVSIAVVIPSSRPFRLSYNGDEYFQPISVLIQ